jgi:hypothetical protein
MEIYKDDINKQLILKEISKNQRLLDNEYNVLKNNTTDINETSEYLLKKYQEYYTSIKNDNNLVIDNLNNIIEYLNKDIDDDKKKEINKLYKMIEKLL